MNEEQLKRYAKLIDGIVDMLVPDEQEAQVLALIEAVQTFLDFLVNAVEERVITTQRKSEEAN